MRTSTAAASCALNARSVTLAPKSPSASAELSISKDEVASSGYFVNTFSEDNVMLPALSFAATAISNAPTGNPEISNTNIGVIAASAGASAGQSSKTVF